MMMIIVIVIAVILFFGFVHFREIVNIEERIFIKALLILILMREKNKNGLLTTWNLVFVLKEFYWER